MTHRGRRFALLVVVLGLLASSATAKTTDPTLNYASSFFAARSVQAVCYLPEEQGSPDSYGAWGYVKKPLKNAHRLHLDAAVCEGALGVNNPELPAWQRALGVMVVVHESWHLRRWHYAGNEAKVECQAIRHWRKGARVLGATPETIEELWPAALAAHYELTNITDWFDDTRPYYDPKCDVPPLITP